VGRGGQKVTEKSDVGLGKERGRISPKAKRRGKKIYEFLIGSQTNRGGLVKDTKKEAGKIRKAKYRREKSAGDRVQKLDGNIGRK